MMKVTVYQDSEGRVYGFQVSGHAGYGRSGKDIVCSAVSALTTNTMNAIEAFVKDPVKYQAVNEEEGFMHYELSEVSKESRLLLDALVLGLKNIEASYGKYIQIEFEEDKTCLK